MAAKQLVLLVSGALFLPKSYWFILFCDSFYKNIKAPALYIRYFITYYNI